MTLYADLGVAPDADMPTIKAAHRRAVKRHHPDTGGDREKFELVQRAWIILSDPVKRGRYDRLGDEGDKPSNEMANLTNVIIPAFDHVLAQAGKDLEHVDIMAATRAYLEDRIGELQKQIHAGAQKKRSLERMSERMSYKGEGPNLIGNVMRERIGAVDRSIAQMKEKIGLYDRAILHLDLYSWDFTPPAKASIEFNDDMMCTVLRMASGKS
jgi:curved DNA-binding protein CbpA